VKRRLLQSPVDGILEVRLLHELGVDDRQPVSLEVPVAPPWPSNQKLMVASSCRYVPRYTCANVSYRSSNAPFSYKRYCDLLVKSLTG
jgi:hypothetical protein